MAWSAIRNALLATLLATSATAAVVDSNSYDNVGLSSRQAKSKGWPYAPFNTKGRDIVNARGEKVTWAGINWPMSGETMVPEGLEKRSVEEIVDDIAGLGMNFIRMGWSTTMVDEIVESGDDDVPLETAFVKALGKQNGTRVTAEVLKRNPSWTKKTGRFEIWSDVVRAAADRGIFVHPDMHMAKAAWCCGHTDGSAWFGDTNFSVANWTRALSYVAKWAGQHDNIVSMALVNELRQPWQDNYPRFHYNWVTLVGNMTLGADAIHAANPDLLISWSGLQFDEDLSALTSGLNLWEAPCYMCVATRDAPRRDPLYFDLADHAWGNKVFYELHLYPMSEDLDTGTCGIIKAQLYRAGFNALGIEPPSNCSLLEDSPLGPCRKATRQTPVLMTEFGASQDGSLPSNPYINCIREFTTENRVGWAVWSLAGSFRIRSGGQEVDDTWGLKTFDWSAWRSKEAVNKVWKPWVKAMKVTRKKN